MSYSNEPAVDTDEMMSFIDPAIGKLVKVKDYQRALRIAANHGRKHYSNKLFLRSDKDYWIEGQMFTVAWPYMRYPNLMFSDDWRPFEWILRAERDYLTRQERHSRWYQWNQRRAEIRHGYKTQVNSANHTKHGRYVKKVNRDEWDSKTENYRTKTILRYMADVALANKVLGEATAKALSTIYAFRKTKPDVANEHVWVMRWDTSMRNRIGASVHSKVFNALRRDFSDVMNARLPAESGVVNVFSPTDYSNTLGLYAGYMQDDEAKCAMIARRVSENRSHFLHTSLEDPLKVAYAPSYAYFIKDRWIRTTFGKYLTKFYGDVLSEAEIREAANRYTAAHRPLELHLVPNTDPDKWAWVYENSSNFKSCMTLNRSDRYVSSDVTKVIKHPAICYAYDHPKNHLALAWIGEDTNGGVWARSIVDMEKKQAVRVYGDDRLVALLVKHGFRLTGGAALVGNIMRAYPIGGHRDTYALPYLDGARYVLSNLNPPEVEVVGGEVVGSMNASSAALASLQLIERGTCVHCGQVKIVSQYNAVDHGFGEVTQLYEVTPPARKYACNSCVPHEFKDAIRAYMRNHNNGRTERMWVFKSRPGILYSEYHGDYFDSTDIEVLSLLELIEYKPGKFNPISKLYWCAHDRKYVLSATAKLLGWPLYTSDGNMQEYADEEYIVTDKWGGNHHKDFVKMCSISGEPGPSYAMLKIGENYFHPSILEEILKKVSIKVVTPAPTFNSGLYKVDATYDPNSEPEYSMLAFIRAWHKGEIRHMKSSNFNGIEFGKRLENLSELRDHLYYSGRVFRNTKAAIPPGLFPTV